MTDKPKATDFEELLSMLPKKILMFYSPESQSDYLYQLYCARNKNYNDRKTDQAADTIKNK